MFRQFRLIFKHNSPQCFILFIHDNKDNTPPLNLQKQGFCYIVKKLSINLYDPVFYPFEIKISRAWAKNAFI